MAWYNEQFSPEANQGLLSFGLGLLANSRGQSTSEALGRAGMMGLQAYQGAKDQKYNDKLRSMQMAQAEEQDRIRKLQASAMQGATTGGQEAIPAFKGAPGLLAEPGKIDFQRYQGLLAQGGDVQGVLGVQPILAQKPADSPFSKVDPKDYTPESLQRFMQTHNHGDLQPVRKMDVVQGQVFDPYAAKPGTLLDTNDPNKPFNIVGGKVVANKPLQSYEVTKAGAGAARVNVPINMGQKGLDNEFKLRGEFKAEPVYKAHQEMQSAYSQIQQSLKQATPAGDLAGATKIMKLLDPGSVVRESELGMAMAASGLMDRASNYANMVITGQKLTPTQRKDFQRLADALMSESTNQFNAKRGEYEKLGGEYGLNAPRALGPQSNTALPAAPAASAPGKVIDFGSLK